MSPEVSPLPSEQALAASFDEATAGLSSVTLEVDSDPRIKVSRIVVAQVADLIDNVRHGISDNQGKIHPAQANHRLLDTAASLATEVLMNTRVDGRLLFTGPTLDSRSLVSAYSKVTHSADAVPELVRKAAMAIKETIHVFQSLSAGSSQDAQRAIGALQELGQRVRQFASHTGTVAKAQSLDVLV